MTERFWNIQLQKLDELNDEVIAINILQTICTIISVIPIFGTIPGFIMGAVANVFGIRASLSLGIADDFFSNYEKYSSVDRFLNVDYKGDYFYNEFL